MYRGIDIGHHTLHDYASAVQVLETRAKRAKRYHTDSILRPGGDEVPLGHPKRNITGVRMDRDENIRFRLYSTDVVVYRPDESVQLEGYDTVTTNAFANELLPAGLRLSKLLAFYGSCFDTYLWSTAGVEVCRVNQPVTFSRKAGRWEPDEKSLERQHFVVPELDTRRAREVSKEYPFADFRVWLFTFCGHAEVAWERTDYAVAADALKRRDFHTAAKHLQPTKRPHGFGSEDWEALRYSGLPSGHEMFMASIDRLRAFVLFREGALRSESRATLTRAEHTRYRAREKQLNSVGFWRYELGL